MTLDAMHWVWTNSQSKGNTRLALLYVADQVRTSACEVRVGHRELMVALNTTSKGTAEAALKTAASLGELEIVEEASGRRPALYRLPKAVGHIRPTFSCAPDSRAQGSASALESRAQNDDQGLASAPKTGAQGKRSAPVFDASAPKTGAPPHTQKEQAGKRASEPDSPQRQQADDYGIPEFARPLVDGLTNAGVVVRWPFVGNQWFPIHALIKKSGVKAMVDHARKAAARANVESAKYFLQGWRELPPLPADSSSVPGAVRPKPPYCGDPDCDEITRTRDHENPDGLFVSVPCPKCHPKRKATAA